MKYLRTAALLSVVALIIACIAPTTQAGNYAVTMDGTVLKASYGSSGSTFAAQGYGSSGVSLRAGPVLAAPSYGSNGGYAAYSEVAVGYGSDGGVSRREARLQRKAARHARRAGVYSSRAGAARVRASYGVSYGASYGVSHGTYYGGGYRSGPCPNGVCP